MESHEMALAGLELPQAVRNDDMGSSAPSAEAPTRVVGRTPV